MDTFLSEAITDGLLHLGILKSEKLIDPQLFKIIKLMR
jgi:hypothetical protein